MNRRIVFFDIDGTLTSEVDSSIPNSAVTAIRKARENGHLMFINTGRCFQNVEPRFREIGFDGYVCGCGTHMICDGEEQFLLTQTPEITREILLAGKAAGVDLLFESHHEVRFDLSRPLKHPKAIAQYERFVERGYDMTKSPDTEGFTCDKFVIWYEQEEQLENFRKTSDSYFTCIDRGGTFREFVPKGYSKATGLQFVLDYYGLSLSDAYAIGDSNNDLPMLNYVPNSIAMGNSEPEDLKEKVSYVTTKASEDGIYHALEHYGLIESS